MSHVVPPRIVIIVEGLHEGGFVFLDTEGNPMKAVTSDREVKEQITLIVDRTFGPSSERMMAEKLAPNKGLTEKVVDYVSWRARP
jgi:hypothetical protein